MIAIASPVLFRARRGAADGHGGVLEPNQAVRHAISQAALLAHFAIEPRGERAAAENVIDDVARHEIRIVARQARPAEGDDRLRHRRSW